MQVWKGDADVFLACGCVCIGAGVFALVRIDWHWFVLHTVLSQQVFYHAVRAHAKVTKLQGRATHAPCCPYEHDEVSPRARG